MVSRVQRGVPRLGGRRRCGRRPDGPRRPARWHRRLGAHDAGGALSGHQLRLLRAGVPARVRGHVPLVALLLACSTPRPTDVLLVTLDTTRADVTGPYGAIPSPTPALDGLAARGVVADEALAVVPLTLPAHSSILTGAYPDTHGVRSNDGFFLPAEVDTLAELLPDHASGAFVSAAVLDHSFGLDAGFETYVDAVARDARRGPMAVPSSPAEQTADRASDWLAEQNGPVLLWMHLYDAHLPHEPPEDLLREHGDPYLAEVARADRALGQILDTFRVLGRDPLVVVVGDHGEGRGDHGEQTHGLFVYRSTMRVPLVIAGPGVEPGRLDVPVSQVDLVPTILDALGQPVPAVDGRSLWAALGGDELDAVPVFGESLYGQLSFGLAPLRVVEDDTHRYTSAPRPERFAWRTDPQELVDLGEDAALLALIEARGEGRSATGGVDAELRARLSALGYVGGGAVVVDGAELPDPKDHTELPVLLERLTVAARTQEPQDAIPMLVAFRERYPAVGAVHLLLASAYELTGQLDEARAALEPLVERSPDEPGLRTRLARMEAGESRRHALEAVLADHPSWTDARTLLVWHLRDAGELRQAREQADLGVATDPDDLPLRLARASVLVELGENQAAERDGVEVLLGAPDDPDVRYVLGQALGRQGRTDEALAVLAEQRQMRPDHPGDAALYGLIAYNAGRFDVARAPLELAARHPDTGFEPPLALADLESMAGRHEEARVWLSAARLLAPDGAPIDTVEATLLLRAGQIEAASQRLK
ncbi:MAG: sulfatase-like hydrolase/transferase [Proteobacteria bacterium]|nr:sulfatase-like hydrolase/transferase [Pseudomonadota bacterium]MCP4922346.1 sulfatase-like hydrolase/transferase [Pseudomonadota bacterium]